MEIDLPEVVAEVTAAFERYEQALVATTSRRSTRCFATIRAPSATAAARTSTATPRSAAFRAARSPVGLARTLSKTVITTYGRDFAVASTLFHRAVVARQDRPPDADLGAVSPTAGASSPRM